MTRLLMLVAATCLTLPALAHHSMLLYDSNRIERIEGTITKTFFGRPHSRYEVRVDTDGESQTWTMIAQDPEDAKRFGYFEELERLTTGTTVEIVGWPHRRNTNELLGHWLRSEVTGYVELIPRSGYARPALYAAMDQAVADQSVFAVVVRDIAGEASSAMLERWVQNDHPIARAGAEVQRQRAKLVAVVSGSDSEYVGMPRYLACQTEIRTRIELPSDDLAKWSSDNKLRFESWVSTYNRVLAKHWELTLSSCGN